MKKSKIIFITLLSLITLYIIAIMVDIRVSGQKWSEFNNTLKVNKTDLEPFSVLVLNNCMELKIEESDSPFIEVLVPNDSPFPTLDFVCKNDTLKISGFQKSSSPITFVNVHIKSGLKTIKMDNSVIMITSISTGKLSLFLDKSDAKFVLRNIRTSIIGTLELNADNFSSVVANFSQIDSVKILMNNSTANLSLSPKIISGKISQSSKLTINQPGEITLKRDSLSTITINSFKNMAKQPL